MLLSISLSLIYGIIATAQPLKPISPGVNGTISAITRYGNSMIIGGSFTLAGTSSGGAFNTLGSNLNTSFPTISGDVYASSSDGTGGWYVGGKISNIGSQSFYNAVHVTGNNQVDQSWIPNINGTVLTMALSGSFVYIGGTFTTVNGQTRNHIARVNKSTGDLDLNWNPSADGDVYCITSFSGGIFVGGNFTNIGGAARNHAAKFADNSDVADAAWNPNTNGNVRAILINDTNVYVAGEFNTIKSKAIPYLAKVGAAAGLPDETWVPKPDAYVYSIAIDDGSMYLVGTFTQVNNETRNRAAKIALSDASLDTGFDPNADNFINSVSVNGNYVYLAGYFEFLGGDSRNGMARIFKSNGLVDTEWMPNTGYQFYHVESANTNIIFCGSNLLTNTFTRNNIAAFDLTTGAINSFDPNADGQVNSLVVSNNNVYAGGWFSFIGGDTRFFLAKLDANTGLVDPNFAPDVNDGVNVLKILGNKLYVGGWFNLIDGWGRKKIARLDTAGGSVDLGWAVNITGGTGNFRVNDIFAASNGIYFGGKFDSVNNIRHNSLAKVNLINGNLDPNFKPQITGEVYSFSHSKGRLFVGGDFTAINDTLVSNLTIIDTATGTPTYTFKPQVNNKVYTIANYDTVAYVGGTFDQVNGKSRNYLTAFSTATLNEDTLRNINVNSYINKIYSASGTMAIGGAFGEVNNLAHCGIAAFGGSVEIKIPLKPGWNVISSNVNADNMAMTSLFSDIVGHIVIVKNSHGMNYIPSFNINNIGNWDITQGYFAFASATDSLIITGTPAAASTPIIMPTGWSWVSYLRSSPKNISTCVGTLTDRSTLIIAKDPDGKTYIPQFNINNIGNMMPGKGYQMFVSSTDTLIYPANDPAKSANFPELTPSPLYLTPNVTRTGNSAVVLLHTYGMDGNEIGAYNQNGDLVGSGIFYGGYAAITVWGDNNITDVVDGAKTGEVIKFKMLDTKNMNLSEIQVSGVKSVIGDQQSDNQILYSPESFVMAKANPVGSNDSKSRIYPNPAEDHITVEYSLPVDSHVKIGIYGIDGREITSLDNSQKSRGEIKELYRIPAISAGAYLLIIETADKKEILDFIKK